MIFFDKRSNIPLIKTDIINDNNLLITTQKSRSFESGLFFSLIEILSINTFATVKTEEGVLIIGGFNNSRAVADVALFDGTNWSSKG